MDKKDRNTTIPEMYYKRRPYQQYLDLFPRLDVALIVNPSSLKETPGLSVHALRISFFFKRIREVHISLKTFIKVGNIILI